MSKKERKNAQSILVSQLVLGIAASQRDGNSRLERGLRLAKQLGKLNRTFCRR